MLKLKLSLATIIAIIAVATIPLFSEGGVGLMPANQKLCPVMGFEITQDIFTDYQNKRIYFCCPSCPPEFKKTPDIFMEQILEQAVILEDVQG